MKKVKIVEAGQPCRKCGTPVIKQSHSKPTRPDQSYWYEYWFKCPNCLTLYMVDKAKRTIPRIQKELT